MTGTTLVYNIRHPNGASKANQLGPELATMAADIEAALIAAEIPPAQPMSIVVAASDGARDAHWGLPASEAERLTLQDKGATTVRTDKGWTERYFATFHATTNPGGATPAGWHPVDGALPLGRVVRSANAATVGTSAFLEASLNTYWVPERNVNIGPLAAGWVVPITGYYELDASIYTAGGGELIAGFTLMAGSVGNITDLFGHSTPWKISSNAYARPHAGPVRLAAGAKVRLFAFATGTAGGWSALPTNSHFAIRYIGPPVGPA